MVTYHGTVMYSLFADEREMEQRLNKAITQVTGTVLSCNARMLQLEVQTSNQECIQVKYQFVV
jgi:hypothetical protein